MNLYMPPETAAAVVAAAACVHSIASFICVQMVSKIPIKLMNVIEPNGGQSFSSEWHGEEKQ